MNKISISKQQNFLLQNKKITPIKILNNDDINSLRIICKFEEKINEQTQEIQEEYKTLISRIKQIFISKTNSSKCSYHPSISYSVGKLGEYIIYLKTIFVEITTFEKGNLIKNERTYFNPFSNSFSVNYQDFTFIFYIYYNQVQIFSNFKEKYYIYATSDLNKIRKNCIELNKFNLFTNKSPNNSYIFNSSNFDNNFTSYNIDAIKNPFNYLREKKIGFSCKIYDKLLEIKYGFEKIYLNGFFETKSELKLSFSEPKEIYIPIDSFIFLEIQINSSINNIKKEIYKKIQILRLLGFSETHNIYFIGVLYNTNYNNIFKINKDDDLDKQNTSNEEKEKMYYEEFNFKIYIYNCDSYFLGQKVSLVRRFFSKDFSKEKSDLLKTPNNNIKSFMKSERHISVDKEKRTSLFSFKKNEQIKETHEIIKELKEINKKRKEEENKIKKMEEENRKKNIDNTNNKFSILKSISNNFSLFDDDMLFSQMNMF